MSSRNIHGKLFLLLGSALLLSTIARADGPPAPSSTSSPFVMIMLIIIFILGMAITLLANVLLGAAQLSSDKEKEEKSGAEAKIMGGAMTVATSTSSYVNGVSNTAFYMITGVVLLEVVILFTLLYNVRLILSIYKKDKAALAEAGAGKPLTPRLSWWDKLNRFKPLDEELSLELDHEYDGIRELDNRLPPWWLYGFYCTILFACVYLWRYHVSHSAPLSGEEYVIEMKKAEIQKAEYLKKAANNIDETSVKLLTGEADLAAGKAVFQGTCFACHGKSGEGGVGPNLTDEYWLHGGSIQEVFKTIKYGWPEKGMKSWKDDYSPSQIAQIASYVKSLGGTHPANPKPPQGTLSK
jgi:cytochrome c oxidase cbb3-type subunit III